MNIIIKRIPIQIPR